MLALVWKFISPWLRFIAGPALIGGAALSVFFYMQHLARENEALSLKVAEAKASEDMLRKSLSHLASVAQAERAAARDIQDKVSSYETFIASMPDRRCRLSRAERERLLRIR